MPSIAIRPCPADARAALEQAGLAPPGRGCMPPAASAIPTKSRTACRNCCRPPACCTSSAPPRCWPTPFATTSACSFADYDADGATACAVGVRGLRLLGAQVDFIVPNRLEHGYGLTP
jgi:Single-stranded DNA-specific exonuclease